MLSVSDILKILDKTPIWKNLKNMPARIEALEKRVSELERQPTRAEYTYTCSQCGAPARVTAIQDHPTFGAMGVKERTVTCENGHSHSYMWDPRKEP